MLQERGITADTIKKLGIGYAPPAYEGLKTALLKEGLPLPLLVRSGLPVERDNGQTVDRFRGRLMIPIARDAGSIVAFGGRAMEKDQHPKYLNSPETTIYTKGKTLYGLNLTKADIRRLGYAVLVEGYFDFAQLIQAGITPVVASSGTALTPAQAQLLRRFTSKVILSFDPDAAGQGAAARSCELLVAEGFEVNVAVLPAGEDPDSVVQKRGRDAYLDLLKNRALSQYCWIAPPRRTTSTTTRDAGSFSPPCLRWRPVFRIRRPVTNSVIVWPTRRVLQKRWYARKSERRPSRGGRS
jgi:DNA primase